MPSSEAIIEPDPPTLLHVGIVVLDMAAAASDFERRWGMHVADVVDVTLGDVRYHNRLTTIAFRMGVIDSGACQIELTQPLSDSPFQDFLRERRADGVHHLSYLVDDIDGYLDRLKPTWAELVLDARLPGKGSRVVLLDGFAHGPAVELVEGIPFRDQTAGLEASGNERAHHSEYGPRPSLLST
jgi:catechol 2,3-dioxygenase-like lactoylglutathione lyase family enzyme